MISLLRWATFSATFSNMTSEDFFCHLDTANTFLALVNAAAFHGFLR